MPLLTLCKAVRCLSVGALLLTVASGCGDTPAEAQASSAGGATSRLSSLASSPYGGELSPADGAGGAYVEDGACSVQAAHFASSVVSHLFGSGQDFGQSCDGPDDVCFPEAVLGGPVGGGANGGSLHVVSLGDGGEIVLGFDVTIVDGPGPDFLVFENVFNVGGDPENPWAELATVSVSEDGETWSEYPCLATAYPYGGCAGWHPTLANVETNAGDPNDPDSAGGDAYDLADVGLERVNYVRIVDVAEDDNVFDLDAVAVVHSECE